ncbi:DUF4836 family protein [Sediminibacterium roseum]|uniref:DUF4836 family protein n=1 Tax=Sediminibacterium roseum TaxID=1978412 RepID=A0ABW9ZQ48_9BACT|nr:DUF4836 family protein [Sediminibacterium roseum]NCI48607.1 DUF4836 family protein [Sediminibacterium roseum]
MKKLLTLFIPAFVFAVALSSCKSNVPKEAKYIPKDAGVVFALDPEQMKDKLQKGGISIDTLIGRIFKDGNDPEDKAMFNAVKDSAGINWESKVFLFVQQKVNADKSSSNTFTVLAGLKDAAKFEAQLKSHPKELQGTIVKEKEYSYLSIPKQTTIVAWNADQVTFTVHQHIQKPVFDTATKVYQQPTTPADAEGEVKRLVARIYTQKVSESMADVKMFTNMFKDKADGYMFSNSNSSLSALSMLPIQPPKLEEFMKDNYATGTLTFEDGKILMKGTAYPNQLVSGILKKYAGPTVDLSMIEHYPSQNINGVMLFAFNPEIFGGVLKQMEVEGLANSFLEKAGLNSADLYKSFKGHIAVVVSDLGIPSAGPDPMNKHNEKTMVEKRSIGKMVMNAPVGDKASFFKIMDLAAGMGYVVKQNNTYKGGALLSMLGVYLQADEKNFVIASDSLTYVNYMAKTSKALINKDALDKFKGKAGAFYFDIAGTINAFTKEPGTVGKYENSALSVKNAFKDVIGTFDNFDGTTVTSTTEVRMQNEKQNSLVTLTSLITDIAVDMRLQAKKEKEAEEKLFPGGVPAIIRTN